jgi:hypothetical protein
MASPKGLISFPDRFTVATTVLLDVAITEITP